MTTIVTCFPLKTDHLTTIVQAAGAPYKVIASDQNNIQNDIMLADIFCGHAKVSIDWTRVVQQGRLQWIQSSAAGLDHCLAADVIESNILVSGCSGLFAVQVAEQTLALLLGAIRRLPSFFDQQQRAIFERLPTDDLHGKHVGIIGLGGNGQRIAQVLRPLVDRIVGTDLFPESCQHLLSSGTINAVFPADQLSELLPDLDVVILTLPLSAQNERLFNADRLKWLKPGAYLINVGRGSVVCTNSLVERLKSGALAGVGLDVVDPEPLPHDSPLWGLENTIITPHVGAQSRRRVELTIELFCENLKRFEQGQKLLNEVDKRLGFPRPEHRIPLAWPGKWM